MPNTNYKQYGPGLFGFKGVTSAGVVGNPFGLVITGFDASTTATEINPKDSDGNTVGAILHDSMMSFKVDGWAVTMASVPNIGDKIEFTTANGFDKVPDKTIGKTATDFVKTCYVSNVSITSSNADMVTVSLDVQYKPNIDFTESAAQASSYIPSEES